MSPIDPLSILLDAKCWTKLPFYINKFTHHHKKVSKITLNITEQLCVYWDSVAKFLPLSVKPIYKFTHPFLFKHCIIKQKEGFWLPGEKAGHYHHPRAAKHAEHLGLSPRTSAMEHHSDLLFTSQPAAPRFKASFMKNSNAVPRPGRNML